MKILVLAENYTNLNNVVSLHYIHTRNQYYINCGHTVDVLSFSTDVDYMLDEVRVFRLEYFNTEKLKEYDIILSHAPNLRNHMKFIKRYRIAIPNLIFFFHGHEVLNTSKIYPKPYFYDKKSLIKNKIEEIYNIIKLNYWKRFTIKFKREGHYIFVSKWMLDMFLEETKVPVSELPNYSIIENSVGQFFLERSYDSHSPKEFDVLTIRNNIDGSKYAIDLVIEQAKNNPELQFCVVGKGDFFKHFSKPDNLTHLDRNLSHEEVVTFLDNSRSIFLPTRLDSQGVMACEVATYGIPLITSDIPICNEMLSDFPNVAFIPNTTNAVNLERIITELENKLQKKKNFRFSEKNTIGKELDVMKAISSVK